MRKYVAVFFISAICLVTTIAQGRVVQLKGTNGAWEYNEQGNNKKEIKIGMNMNEIEGMIQVMHAYVNNLDKSGLFGCETNRRSPGFAIYVPEGGDMQAYIADKTDEEPNYLTKLIQNDS